MSGARFRILRFNAAYDRSPFNCGSEALDRYFHRQVTQDIRRRVTACFVAITSERRIAGYYTLSAASVPLAELPDSVRKKLPCYPYVPVVRLGRLAVDKTFQGQGLGGALLANALIRVRQSDIAAYALIADAKDDSAKAFYQHHGFIALPDSPLTLFLPLASVKAL